MLNKNRIEAFSDGVIAIIITVMVFDLKIPALAAGFSDTDVWAALMGLLPKLAAYALSYLILAIMWINHHALFDKVPHSTPALVWHNALLLFAMSLIPLPTAFLSSNPLLPQAAMFYGAVMSLNAGSFLLLRRYVEVKAGMLKHSAVVHRSNAITLSLYVLPGSRYRAGLLEAELTSSEGSIGLRSLSYFQRRRNRHPHRRHD